MSLHLNSKRCNKVIGLGVQMKLSLEAVSLMCPLTIVIMHSILDVATVLDPPLDAHHFLETAIETNVGAQLEPCKNICDEDFFAK